MLLTLILTPFYAYSALEIPVTYLPEYQKIKTPSGKEKVITKYGQKELQINNSEVALVLVDVWEKYWTSKDGTALWGPMRKAKKFLEKARKNGIHIIHAPGNEIAVRYAQNMKLKAETQSFLKLPSAQKAISQWPSSENFEKLRSSKFSFNASSPAKTANGNIAKPFRPIKGEAVVGNRNQFRYYLWKNKIKTLIYIGGSTNACVLNHDVGLYHQTSFTSILLSDASGPSPSPRHDWLVVKEVMEDFIMGSLAYVTKTSDIRWVD